MAEIIVLPLPEQGSAIGGNVPRIKEVRLSKIPASNPTKLYTKLNVYFFCGKNNCASAQVKCPAAKKLGKCRIFFIRC
jgi:hypothetical protein